MRAFELFGQRVADLYKQKLQELCMSDLENNMFRDQKQVLETTENLLEYKPVNCQIREAFIDQQLQDYVENNVLPNSSPDGDIALIIVEWRGSSSPRLILEIQKRDESVINHANKISDKAGIAYVLYDSKNKALSDATLLKLACSSTHDVEVHNKLSEDARTPARELADLITKDELDALEERLDKLYQVLGLDVEFTNHFHDRVNDPRNRKQITIEELFKIFQETLKVHGKKIAQAGPDFEAVMNDISTDLNIPFVLRWNNATEELELISKTVMRKDNFMTSTPKLTVGLTSKKNK